MSTLQEAQEKLKTLLNTPISVAEVKLEGDEPNTKLVPKKVEKTVRELSGDFVGSLCAVSEYGPFNPSTLLGNRVIETASDNEPLSDGLEKHVARLQEFNQAVTKIENGTFDATQDAIGFYKGILALEFIGYWMDGDCINMTYHQGNVIDQKFGTYAFQADGLHTALKNTVTSDDDKEALLQAVQGIIAEIDCQRMQWNSKTASQELAVYLPNPLDDYNFINDSRALRRLVSVISGSTGDNVDRFLQRVKELLPKDHPLQHYECPQYMPHIASMDTPVDIGNEDEMRFSLQCIETHNSSTALKIMDGFLEVGKLLGLQTNIRKIEHEVNQAERRNTAALGSIVSTEQIEKKQEPQP